jgi:hypothetical protein
VNIPGQLFHGETTWQAEKPNARVILQKPRLSQLLQLWGMTLQR